MKEGKSFEMAIKIHFRRFASVLLCCLLVFCSLPVQVHASDPVTAASLAITGGQLAGAGLSGEAALSLAGPVGAVVGVTLGALGVNAYVSQAAQEAGKTRTRFVLDKLVIWGAQAGYTQEQLYSKIAQGISVAADGSIQLTHDVSNSISQFVSWLFAQPDAVVESVPAGESTVKLSDFTLAPCSANIDYSVTRYGNPRNFKIDTSGFSGFGILAGSVWIFTKTNYGTSSVNTSNRLHYSSSYSNGMFSYMGNKGDFYVYCNAPGGEGLSAPSYFPDSGMSASSFSSYVFNSQNILTEVTTPAVDAVFVGHESDWDENKDLLNPSAEDTPIVLNPDLLNPIIDSLADGQQATMSIIDYLQALQDAWDHALDDVQTAIGTITDSLTGIQEQIAVPQTAVENPTITNPSVTPDTTPILNPSDVDPGTAITGLSFDLTNIFPFCIPFDIYAALNLLDAEPVAPSYHVHLEWPYNIIIDFTIDLSPFNQVAAVARTMEILLFIIGLAVMTRSMFIRG